MNICFPNEWKYNDGWFTLDGKLPDFVNVNGEKKIIDFFGHWWHGKKHTGKTESEAESERIKMFAKYGYETLIIWGKDLANTDETVRRLYMFNNKASRHTEPMQATEFAIKTISGNKYVLWAVKEQKYEAKAEAKILSLRGIPAIMKRTQIQRNHIREVSFRVWVKLGNNKLIIQKNMLYKYQTNFLEELFGKVEVVV